LWKHTSAREGFFEMNAALDINGFGSVAAFAIVAESETDAPAREALLDRAMGTKRKRKSSEKLRRGRRPSEGLAFVVRDADGAVVGTVRLWDVAVKKMISSLAGEMGGSPEGGAVPPTRAANDDGLRSTLPPSALPGISPARGEFGSGDVAALLLGPLAVDPSLKGAGIGSALVRRAIEEARRLGHKAILLVGDAPYYGRFGFSAEKTGGLAMPGPYERHRLLALELEPGALDGAGGVIRATGRKITKLSAAA
jgi:predicted N-acetyltransferase YhbS